MYKNIFFTQNLDKNSYRNLETEFCFVCSVSCFLMIAHPQIKPLISISLFTGCISLFTGGPVHIFNPTFRASLVTLHYTLLHVASSNPTLYIIQSLKTKQRFRKLNGQGFYTCISSIQIMLCLFLKLKKGSNPPLTVFQFFLQNGFPRCSS